MLQLLQHANLCENGRLHQSDLAPLLILASTGEGAAASRKYLDCFLAPDPKSRASFYWFGRNRRFVKDFENLTKTVTTFVTLASIRQAACPRVRPLPQQHWSG
jgi:hypothetical protein